MPIIQVVDTDGKMHSLQAQEGETVMNVVQNNGIAGMVGECGGDLSCGTCHVYVDEAWQTAVGEPSSDEVDMLEVVDDLRPGSRLSCRLEMSSALDGLIVTVANN